MCFAARRKAVQPCQRQFLLKLQNALCKGVFLGLQCSDLAAFAARSAISSSIVGRRFDPSQS
jgi:hypothetical protein